MMTRRTFVAMCGAAGAGLIAGRARATSVPEDRLFEWKAVGEKAHAAFGFGGNALVLIGSGGCVLIDCKNAPYGVMLRREAEAVGGAKLAGVINTHHHADHTGGNHAFTPDVPTYAHQNASPRVLAQMNRYISQAKEAATQLAERTGAAADAARAEAKAYYLSIESRKATDYAPRTGVGDSHTLELAGLSIELRRFGPGHTDNDLVVHVPSMNVVHTGDLLFNGRHPFVDRDSGATTTGWEASLRKVIELCDAKTRVVPGHGELCGVEALRTQIEYFGAMREAVAKAVAAGKTRKEVAEMDPGVFAQYGSARRDMVLGAMFDEAKAAK